MPSLGLDQASLEDFPENRAKIEARFKVELTPDELGSLLSRYSIFKAIESGDKSYIFEVESGTESGILTGLKEEPLISNVVIMERVVLADGTVIDRGLPESPNRLFGVALLITGAAGIAWLLS